DDEFALGQAGEDLSLGRVAAADGDGAGAGVAVLDSEDGPGVGGAEEGAGGDLQDVGLLPDDDAGLDTEAVAEGGAGLGRIGEVDDDPDALLLDAEGGDLREGGGLDEADDAVEGLVAPPLLKVDVLARADGDGFRREDIDLGFEVGGVADFEEG